MEPIKGPTIWSYGITTVPERRHTTLPRTLHSLALAGFPSPHLFIDGGNELEVQSDGAALLTRTVRIPRTTIFLNWYLGLAELYGRNPNAHRYAMFQDDFVTYRNLRQYLEKVPYPEKGYLNLYTAFNSNEPVIRNKPVGWYEASLLNPGEPWQTGRGAIALVFSNDAVRTLLTAPSFINKPQAADKVIATRKLDGGIVTAMNMAGYREYIHNPSLVQHTGDISTWKDPGNPHPHALSFRGEDFDALSLLAEWPKGEPTHG